MFKTLGTQIDIGGRMSYTAFAIGTTEDLVRSWATDEQREYNASHRTCPACNGRGYAIQRHGGRVTPDKGGCSLCLGLGAVELGVTD